MARNYTADIDGLYLQLKDELDRSDFTIEQTADYANRLIQQHNSAPLFFNRPSFTFSTVASQEYYGAAASSSIPGVSSILSVLLTSGDLQYPLERKTEDEIDAMRSSTSITGRPYVYAYDTLRFRFYEIPDAAYTITVKGSKTYAAMEGTGATSDWLTYDQPYEFIKNGVAEMLNKFRWRDMDGAALYAGEKAAAWARLTLESRRRRGPGKIIYAPAFR